MFVHHGHFGSRNHMLNQLAHDINHNTNCKKSTERLNSGVKSSWIEGADKATDNP